MSWEGPPKQIQSQKAMLRCKSAVLRSEKGSVSRFKIRKIHLYQAQARHDTTKYDVHVNEYYLNRFYAYAVANNHYNNNSQYNDLSHYSDYSGHNPTTEMYRKAWITIIQR